MLHWKNIFFLAVLKLEVKDSFGYNKEIESESIYKQYKIILYKHYLAYILEWTWKWKSQHYAVLYG